MDIKTKVLKIKEKIKKQQLKLSLLQKECTHPNVDREYCSNTGNYDQASDYWIHFNCPDCDKIWNEDQ